MSYYPFEYQSKCKMTKSEHGANLSWKGNKADIPASGRVDLIITGKKTGGGVSPRGTEIKGEMLYSNGTIHIDIADLDGDFLPQDGTYELQYKFENGINRIRFVFLCPQDEISQPLISDSDPPEKIKKRTHWLTITFLVVLALCAYAFLISFVGHLVASSLFFGVLAVILYVVLALLYLGTLLLQKVDSNRIKNGLPLWNISIPEPPIGQKNVSEEERYENAFSSVVKNSESSKRDANNEPAISKAEEFEDYSKPEDEGAGSEEIDYSEPCSPVPEAMPVTQLNSQPAESTPDKTTNDSRREVVNSVTTNEEDEEADFDWDYRNQYKQKSKIPVPVVSVSEQEQSEVNIPYIPFPTRANPLQSPTQIYSEFQGLNEEFKREIQNGVLQGEICGDINAKQANKRFWACLAALVLTAILIISLFVIFPSRPYSDDNSTKVIISVILGFAGILLTTSVAQAYPTYKFCGHADTSEKDSNVLHPILLEVDLSGARQYKNTNSAPWIESFSGNSGQRLCIVFKSEDEFQNYFINNQSGLKGVERIEIEHPKFGHVPLIKKV